MSEKMKPSGIAWIGDIPESWEVKKLGLLCKQIGDIDHYMPDSVDEGVPYVMTGDFVGTQNEIDFENCKKISYKDFLTLSKKIKPAKGDILFARYATIGTARYVETKIDFLVSYACLIVKPLSEKICGRFLYHCFFSSSFYEEVSKYINVNTQANVGSDSLKRVKISIPPRLEQTLIADFLDKQCAKIDSVTADIEKQIDLLDKYKKSLITETVTKGLNKNVPMKDSGIEWIGEIPKHWDLTKIRFVTQLRSEQKRYSKESNYIGLENISSYTGEFIATESEYKEGKYDVYKKGDLLFSKLRPYLAKAIITTDEGFCTGELAVIQFFAGDKRYLWYFLLSDGFLKMVDASTYGSKMPRANWDYIKNLPIPNICIIEQTQIVNFLGKKCAKVDAIIETKKQQLELMKKHKQSMIYEYVTGKKRVTEVQS